MKITSDMVATKGNYNTGSIGVLYPAIHRRSYLLPSPAQKSGVFYFAFLTCGLTSSFTGATSTGAGYKTSSLKPIQ